MSSSGGKAGWKAAAAAAAIAIAVLGAAVLLYPARRPNAAPASSAASEFVTGRVVDASGNPVAGAQVGTSVQLAGSAEATVLHVSYAGPPVVTGADGRFAIPARPISYTRALVAKKGDLLGYAIHQGAEPAEIRLAEPAYLDLAAIKHFGSNGPLGADLVSGKSTVGYGQLERHASWAVPLGGFDLVFSNPEIKQQTTPVTFDRPARQTLTVTLEPTAWVKSLGRPAPPLTPGDLRNSQSVSPAALRGKWVLVDFWATWCVPCVREMPRLISFYTEHAKDRGRFEIVAVHSADGKSFAGIKPRYDPLVAKAWGGKDIPFPMVFDGTGATQERWGVEAYPTTLMIDPRGRLAGVATIDDLAKKIG